MRRPIYQSNPLEIKDLVNHPIQDNNEFGIQNNHMGLFPIFNIFLPDNNECQYDNIDFDTH